MEKEPLRGVEFMCRAVDCLHNDKPFCLLFIMGTHLIIGSGGLCVRYENKNDAA